MLLTSALAIAQPTTQPPRPGFGGAGAGGNRGEMLLQRFKAATADLDLSEQQKTQISEILDKAKEQISAMLPELQNMDQQARQQKIRDFMMDLRQKIADVLTDEQKQKLQEKLQSMRGGNARPGAPGQRGAGQPGAGQPGAGQPGAPRAQMPLRIQQTLQRLQDSLDSLGLTGDQKTQVQSIVDDGKKQFAEMRDKVQAGTMKTDEMRTQAPQILAGMRDQLAGVLTTDQQEKLRDAIQSRFDRDNGSTNMPNVTPTTKPSMKMDSMDEKPQAHHEDAPAPAAKPQALAPIDTGPKIGQPAPEVSLEGLNGRPVQLSSFKGKPLVIEFGSYTSPSFRQRAAKMQELSKQYGLRANFLIVYTKEAHAQGEWEIDRNRDEGVKMARHADLTARKSAAKEARQTLKLTIPIAVDSMDDAAAKAFGAGENSAVVIGRDGKIAAKEMWCDPYRLRAALDEALTIKPTTGPIE